MNYIDSREFLDKSASISIIDVRSPGEYLTGHIPGAHNIPLFTDEERKKVGTLYKRSGRKESVRKGLEFTGPKMPDFIDQAEKLAAKGKLLVHCWRGGMRSEAMAWLLETAGFSCELLSGGYKAYRKYIRENIYRGKKIIVLGGLTGSGKTRLLMDMKKLGEPVIDLEGLANHKGSAFGGIGQDDQPSTEQFENNLFREVDSIVQEYFWVEDESLRIGKVFIPEPFYKRMLESILIFIKVSEAYRHKILLDDYSGEDRELLIQAIGRIQPRLGGQAAKLATEAVRSGDYLDAVKILLDYYDKTYMFSLGRKNQKNIIPLDLTDAPENHFPDLVINIKTTLLGENNNSTQ